MDVWQKIKQLFDKLMKGDLTDDQKKEMETELSQLQEEAKKAAKNEGTTEPPPKKEEKTGDNPSEVLAAVQALKDELQKEREGRESLARRIEDQEKARKEEEADAVVEEAFRTGRITAEQKDQTKKDLLANFEPTKRMLDLIPANTALNKADSKDGKSGSDHEGKKDSGVSQTDYAALRQQARDALKPQA